MVWTPLLSSRSSSAVRPGPVFEIACAADAFVAELADDLVAVGLRELADRLALAREPVAVHLAASGDTEIGDIATSVTTSVLDNRASYESDE